MVDKKTPHASGGRAMGMLVANETSQHRYMLGKYVDIQRDNESVGRAAVVLPRLVGYSCYLHEQAQNTEARTSMCGSRHAGFVGSGSQEVNGASDKVAPFAERGLQLCHDPDLGNTVLVSASVRCERGTVRRRCDVHPMLCGPRDRAAAAIERKPLG